MGYDQLFALLDGTLLGMRRVFPGQDASDTCGAGRCNDEGVEDCLVICRGPPAPVDGSGTSRFHSFKRKKIDWVNGQRYEACIATKTNHGR